MHPCLLQKFPLTKAVPIRLFIFRLSCFNNDAQTKGIKKCRITKCERTMGPTFWDFGVRDVRVYKHLSFKQDDTWNAELRNAKGLWALHFKCRILGFSKTKELRDSVTVSPKCQNVHFVFNPLLKICSDFAWMIRASDFIPLIVLRQNNFHGWHLCIVRSYNRRLNLGNRSSWIKMLDQNYLHMNLKNKSTYRSIF